MVNNNNDAMVSFVFSMAEILSYLFVAIFYSSSSSSSDYVIAIGVSSFETWS
jgi:hypothetical protein